MTTKFPSMKEMYDMKNLTREIRVKSLSEHMGAAVSVHKMLQQCEAGMTFSERDYAAACGGFLHLFFVYPVVLNGIEFSDSYIVDFKIADEPAVKFGIMLATQDQKFGTNVRKVFPESKLANGMPSTTDILDVIKRAFPEVYITNSTHWTNDGKTSQHVTLREFFLPPMGLIATEGTATCTNHTVAYMQAATRLLHNFLMRALHLELLIEHAAAKELSSSDHLWDVSSYTQLSRQAGKTGMMSTLYKKSDEPEVSAATKKIRDGLKRHEEREDMLEVIARAFGLPYTPRAGRPVEPDHELAKAVKKQAWPGRPDRSYPSPWKTPMHSIFTDPPYQPNAEYQSKDRTHRKTGESMDEIIRKTLASKKETAESITRKILAKQKATADKAAQSDFDKLPVEVQVFLVSMGIKPEQIRIVDDKTGDPVAWMLGRSKSLAGTEKKED